MFRRPEIDPLGEYLPLVRDLAVAQARPGRPLGDLLGAGIVALFEAERNCAAIGGTNFEACVAYRVLNRMRSAAAGPSFEWLVADLPEAEQTVLRRLLVDGLPRREVAAALATSAERVRQLRSKALRRLRANRKLAECLSKTGSPIV